MMAEKIYLSTDYHQILEEIFVYRNLYLSRLVLGDANNRLVNKTILCCNMLRKYKNVAKEFNIYYSIIIWYLINLCY